jgi:TRAP-type C4-dicarboxylate transport system substrate-binding protein
MLRRNFLCSAKALGAALALAPGQLSAQEVNLRYAHVGAEGDIQYWYAEQAAQRIPEVTEGRVTVTVFPNSQLGGVQETIDGVRGDHVLIAPPFRHCHGRYGSRCPGPGVHRSRWSGR